MPELTPQLRRGLVGLCAALLFAGVIGAIAVEPESDDDTVFAGQSDRTSTTSDFRLGGDGGGDAPGGSTEPTLGASPATSRPAVTTTRPRATGTTGTPPPTTPADADPGPTRPPALGTYNYSTSVTDAEGTRTSDRPMKVEAGQDSAGVTRRVSTTETEQGTIKVFEAWAADGVRQERAVLGPVDCDWQPDILVYAQPLSVGQKWSGDSSCEATAQGQRVKVRIQGERHVTGRATTTVGGTRVIVWVLDTKRTVTVTSVDGATTYQTDKVTELTHFEPTRGLMVYDKATAERSGFGGSGTSTIERRLLNLNPS